MNSCIKTACQKNAFWRRENLSLSVSDIAHAARLAEIITDDFYNDRLDLTARGISHDSAQRPRLPEAECVEILRASGVSDRDVRLYTTFVAAMDRARDATSLWNNGLRLFRDHPELFDPSVVLEMPIQELREILSVYKVSQRHGPDSDAWGVIARSLVSRESPVRRVIDSGFGDAKELLDDLRSSDRGQTCFPLLRGEKIGPMWVRMLAYPGGAKIDNIDIIPVAVDVHVRRVTENLGITKTSGISQEITKPVIHSIQSAWCNAVGTTKIGGPEGIADTCAALDTALWVFGKHGCSHCKKVGHRVPISSACEQCQFRVSS